MFFTLMGRALASRPTIEAGPACLHAGSPAGARAAPDRCLATAAAWPPNAGDGVRVAPRWARLRHALAFTCRPRCAPPHSASSLSPPPTQAAAAALAPPRAIAGVAVLAAPVHLSSLHLALNTASSSRASCSPR